MARGFYGSFSVAAVEHFFRGQGYIRAETLAIQSGFKSRTQAIGERGGDAPRWSMPRSPVTTAVRTAWGCALGVSPSRRLPRQVRVSA